MSAVAARSESVSQSADTVFMRSNAMLGQACSDPALPRAVNAAT